MKRRGFLGIIGGAAVAGPRVAKEVVSKLPVGLGDATLGVPPFGGYGSQGLAEAVPSNSSWRLTEIANLRKIITGEMTDQEKEDQRRQKMYAQQNIISQSVASLVSVSGVRKLEMYQERMALHGRRIQQSEARSRLHWLLRQDD
ncbi:hypothetical protein EVC28_068 [Rhizobium phage RHph_I1_23]|nr:hypothetical protein EVC28_068 [Rhizobium phage RHph_I1_23]